MLTASERRQFDELGFLKVTDCMPAADVAIELDAIWPDLQAHLDVSRHDPSTWRGQYTGFAGPALKRLARGGRMVSQRLAALCDELLGAASWDAERWSRHPGFVFASFPNGRPWELAGEWHWDNAESRHIPTPTGLQICVLLSDTGHQAGGTLFVSGSHRVVADHFLRTRGRWSDSHSSARMRSFCATDHTDGWFRDLEQGAVPPEHRRRRYMDTASVIDGVPLQVREMTGKAGDAYVLHPLVVHAGARNGGRTPRIMRRMIVSQPQASQRQAAAAA